LVSINTLIARLSSKDRQIINLLVDPLKYIASFIDFLYPKDNKTIVVGSNTGEYASGSPKALFEYIRENHPDYKVYYYLPYQENSGYRQMLKYIIRFAPYFFRAKFLITSHPPSDFYPFFWSKRKVLINTWHGTPLKAMFFADSGDSKRNLKRIAQLSLKISAFMVSSRLEAALLTKCFLVNPGKFCYTGQPKNDNLFNGKVDPTVFHGLEDVLKNNKAILYCPTYRRDRETRFFPFENFQVDELNRFLKENHLVILIRGHVYEKGPWSKYLGERIIDFGFNRCHDINSALPGIDILVTDYSSIYIDYFLLDRPCIFIPYDLDEYESGRGLLLDDYEFWTPGHHVLTYDEFIRALKDILSGNDAFISRRREINRQLNYYQTGDSCRKVFELIENWSKYQKNGPAQAVFPEK
jgi:CDP-glycerol glycerophosphotransferase (TagB/SpsB family)